MMGDVLVAIAVSALSAIIGMGIGGAISRSWSEPTIADQRSCGTDRASYAWGQGGKRLVVCERPSGLVVREVEP